MEKLRIFISSTMEDLQEERMSIVEAIGKNRFWESAYAESFVARSESPRALCLDEVRSSHIYIGIFKNRYGYIPVDDNPRQFSVVALEYEEAKKNQIPIFIFVYKNTNSRETELANFLKRLTDFTMGHWCKEYSNIDELVILAIETINSELVRTYIKANNTERSSMVERIYGLPYFNKLRRNFNGR